MIKSKRWFCGVEMLRMTCTCMTFPFLSNRQIFSLKASEAHFSNFFIAEINHIFKYNSNFVYLGWSKGVKLLQENMGIN